MKAIALLSALQNADIVLPTTEGREICLRRITDACAPAVSALIEAGNVLLPHPAWQSWVNDLLEECAAFQNSGSKR